MGRKKADAPRLAVIAEWDVWASKHVPAGTVAKGSDAMLFYTHLQRNRSDLLEFAYPGDKWQAVHGWLRRVYRVKD